MLDLAVDQGRLLVTENFADYSLLLEQRLARAQACVPVVLVHKAGFRRRGPLARRLALRRHSWALGHPDPYVGPHWV